MNWIESLKCGGVTETGVRFGLSELSGSSLSPCPHCHAPARGSSDHRGPIGVRPDDKGWQCHRCKETGDAVNLASWVVLGKKQPTSSEDWRRLEQEAIARGGVQIGGTVSAVSIHKPAVPVAPPRPDARELREFWQTCLPVDSDPEVLRWAVELRHLDASELVSRDLVRAVRKDARLPRWAYYRGEPWNVCEQQFRIVVQMFDAEGRFSSVHARALSPIDPKGRDKAAAPALGPGSVSGLVMADGLARLMLADGVLGDGRKARQVVSDVCLVITEGEPDFLTWGTRYSEANEWARAVLGIVAGSWTEEIAASIPFGTHVCVATHHDADGEKYAAKVWGTLHQRCPLFRTTPKERPNVLEAAR